MPQPTGSHASCVPVTQWQCFDSVNRSHEQITYRSSRHQVQHHLLTSGASDSPREPSAEQVTGRTVMPSVTNPLTRRATRRTSRATRRTGEPTGHPATKSMLREVVSERAASAGKKNQVGLCRGSGPVSLQPNPPCQYHRKRRTLCVVPVRDVPKRVNQRTPSGRWVIPTGNRRHRHKHLHVLCTSYATEREADRKCKAESLDGR